MLRQAGLGIHAESLRYSFLCFIPVYLNGRSQPCRNALWDAFLHTCLDAVRPAGIHYGHARPNAVHPLRRSMH